MADHEACCTAELRAELAELRRAVARLTDARLRPITVEDRSGRSPIDTARAASLALRLA